MNTQMPSVPAPAAPLTPMKVMVAALMLPLIGAALVLAYATHIGVVAWG